MINFNLVYYICCTLFVQYPVYLYQVKKMREDINKTGQILQDFEINKMDIKSPEQEIIEFKGEHIDRYIWTRLVCSHIYIFGN